MTQAIQDPVAAQKENDLQELKYPNLQQRKVYLGVLHL